MTDLIKDSPLLILEGADATGKSTLAEELAEAQDRKIIHAGPPLSKSWPEEYIESVVPQSKVQSYVLDRWHLGEYIWPPILGRESLYEDVLQMVQCHRMLAGSGAFTIIMVRPVIEIVRELQSRDEDDYAIVTAIQGQEEYMKLVRSAKLERTIMTTLPVARELLGLA